MIIWRGWGILGVGLALIGALLGVSIGNFGGSDAMSIGAGLGVAAGGVGAYFAGKHLNQTRPEQKVESFVEQRRQELDASVRSGRFQLAPGAPTPTSLEDAQAQADELLGHERRHVSQQLTNRHTLFFVPLQYAAFAIMAIGLVITVLGIVTALS